ncbi:MAG: aminoglycoside phosphotransferase family protein [Caldilineaceae bacterium]
MSNNMISIPETFARDTVTREGEVGQHWLDQLPMLIERLCDQWHLTIDGTPMHGYLGLVLPMRKDNEPCVLKVSWLDPSNQEEALALTEWNGQGAVRLLECDLKQGALLLERLEQRQLNDLPIDEALRVAGRLLRQLAIVPNEKFRSQSALAQEMLRNMPARWQQVGRPFAQQLLDYACELVNRHAQPRHNLLVNYDIHYENVLAGNRAPWLAIDPKVLVGDPEFGIAQLLMNRLEEIESQGGLERHFQILVEAAELDVDLARAWTFVRTLDYWLWGLGVGLTEDPKRCAQMIEWLNSEN